MQPSSSFNSSTSSSTTAAFSTATTAPTSTSNASNSHVMFDSSSLPAASAAYNAAVGVSPPEHQHPHTTPIGGAQHHHNHNHNHNNNHNHRGHHSSNGGDGDDEDDYDFDDEDDDLFDLDDEEEDQINRNHNTHSQPTALTNNDNNNNNNNTQPAAAFTHSPSSSSLPASASATTTTTNAPSFPSDSRSSAASTGQLPPMEVPDLKTPLPPSILYRPIKLPTKGPTDINFMESCITRSVMTAVGGTLMGGAFGLFISSADTTPYDEKMSTKERLVFTLKDMKTKSWSYAKQFGILGLMFTAFECPIEKARGKKDIKNAAAAGCLTGAAVSWRGGPQAMGVGCVGFAAFSSAMEYFMTHM